MKLLLVTDAWEPQTNGVVNTLKNVILRLRERGTEVAVVEPSAFRTFPCPGYPEIRWVANPWRMATWCNAGGPTRSTSRRRDRWASPHAST